MKYIGDTKNDGLLCELTQDEIKWLISANFLVGSRSGGYIEREKIDHIDIEKIVITCQVINNLKETFQAFQETVLKEIENKSEEQS